MLFPQFFCKSKTILKYKVYFKNQIENKEPRNTITKIKISLNLFISQVKMRKNRLSKLEERLIYNLYNEKKRNNGLKKITEFHGQM